MPDSQIKILLDVMLEQILDLTIKQESLECFKSYSELRNTLNDYDVMRLLRRNLTSKPRWELLFIFRH